MLLNLSDIIDVPGGKVPFECELDLSDLGLVSVAGFTSPVRAAGEVRNSAGVLTLEGEIIADMLCVCDRCCAEFPSPKAMKVTAYLAAELIDEENPEIFLLDGDNVDIGEVLSTCFMLDMETKFLCEEDCAGLCESCGANLNDGPCSCAHETDPRLAVLKQLLDIEQE